MQRTSRRIRRDDQNEGLGMRLLAAMVAFPIFELSLLIASLLISGKGMRRFMLLYFHIPGWVHLVYALTAVFVGLLFGFKGVTWLLGHLFLTHPSDERDKGTTIFLWAGIIGLAFLGSLAAHP